jgi:hypothetical protein
MKNDFKVETLYHKILQVKPINKRRDRLVGIIGMIVATILFWAFFILLVAWDFDRLF